MKSNHKYSDTFYNYIENGSISSAEKLLPIVLSEIKISNVVDLGCGRGAWLTVFKKLGIQKITGIDGDYVDKNNLLINKQEFHPFDLGSEINLEEKYDLAMSLEVAEHLPSGKADLFIDNLVKLGDIVLFSSAIVGQGGEFHVNERPLEYWKEKFEARGYSCYDYFRDKISHEKNVMPWYKYNTLLYANSEGIKRLPESILNCFVPPNQKVKSLGSLRWRIRIWLVKFMPRPLATFIAKVNSIRHSFTS